jgi:23S rRNA (adenine2503-C2)-methyltransferase
MSSVVDLRACTLDDVVAVAQGELGEPRYRGEQIWRWVHGRGATSFEQMTDVSRPLRARLAERASIGTLEVAEVQRSADGTRKLRLRTCDGRSIESVLIPDGEKLTQCISSQVGCALDCQFCATAKLGLVRHLDAGEIADQVYRAQALLADEAPGRRITNLVYMGMGEPLHNYQAVMKSIAILTHGLGANLSQRRITVSTVGLVPGIERLGREPLRPNLAVSLNASSDDVRDRLMPVNKKWPIARLLDALRAFPLEHRRRITFEYVLLAGVNDSMEDAERLARLLRPMRCKLNLIPWNPHPGAPFARPSREAIESFQNRVKELGLAAYLRTPRGDDIAAACGQLANRGGAEEGAPARARLPLAQG